MAGFPNDERRDNSRHRVGGQFRYCGYIGTLS